MKERDCANCKHHTSDGCSSWDCEYEPKDLISRADAIEMAVDVETPQGTYERAIYVDDLMALPSADAEQGYTEWLEKIIVDNEGANEWLCEDTPDLEWCDENCHYSSIQAECLRHLYEVSKGGDDE